MPYPTGIMLSGDFSIAYVRERKAKKSSVEEMTSRWLSLEVQYEQAMSVCDAVSSADAWSELQQVQEWLANYEAETVEGKASEWLWLKAEYEQAVEDDDEFKVWDLGQRLERVEHWLEKKNKASRKPRGFGGITSHGKRMVRSGCVLLEKQVGKRCLAFFTATLPSLPRLEMLAVVERWSEIVRRFNEEIIRELKRRELNPQLVGVTEIQEKRFAKEGLAVPHLHLLFQGRRDRSQPWVIRPEWFRQKWEAVLGNILKRPIDLPSATRVESVRKSAMGYMAKYMSKGGKVLNQIQESDQPCKLPSAWWHMTDTLRSEIKKKTRRIILRCVDFVGLLEWLREGAGCIYAEKVVLEEYGDVVMAIYGRWDFNRIEEFFDCLLSYGGLKVQSAIA